MTCLEFCKMFDVYITFDKQGYGQIFGKGSHPPKRMESCDFWVPTNGNDTGLLPCLVSDYNYYSSQHKAILISPTDEEKPHTEESDTKEEVSKDKKIPIMECNDFKANDPVETNVEVVYVGGWPDTAHLKLDETIYHLILFDGKHHFVYDTKSDDHPEVGKKVYLKAKIKKQTDQTDVDIPAFEVSGVKILRAKK